MLQASLNASSNSSNYAQRVTQLSIMSTILVLLYFASLLNYLSAAVLYNNLKESKKHCSGILNILILTILEGVQNQFFFIYETNRFYVKVTLATESNTVALPPVEMLFYTCYALGNLSLFLRNYWVFFLSVIRILSILKPVKMKNILTKRLSKGALICLSGPALVMVAFRYYLDVVSELNRHQQLTSGQTNITYENKIISEVVFHQLYFALQSALPPTGVLLCSALTVWKLYMSRLAGRRGSHAARTVLAVCVVFFLCQYPSFLLTLSAGLIWPDKNGSVPEPTSDIINIIIILDSCLNFFIFVVCYPSFYSTLLTLICRRNSRSRSTLRRAADNNNDENHIEPTSGLLNEIPLKVKSVPFNVISDTSTVLVTHVNCDLNTNCNCSDI